MNLAPRSHRHQAPSLAFFQVWKQGAKIAPLPPPSLHRFSTPQIGLAPQQNLSFAQFPQSFPQPVAKAICQKMAPPHLSKSGKERALARPSASASNNGAAHRPVGDVRDRCRWQKKGALRTWLVLGYAEHCKFAFGKHCSGRKNQGKRKPADFFGTATGKAPSTARPNLAVFA